jgi:hypothetical protein
LGRSAAAAGVAARSTASGIINKKRAHINEIKPRSGTMVAVF